MKTLNYVCEDAEAYITEIGKLKDIVERQMFEINRLRTVIRQENPSKFYVLKIWADVDPILSRPMESKTERDDFALLTKKEDEEDSGIYWIDQVQGELKAGAYPGNFFEEDVPGKVEEAKLTYGSKKTEAYLNELYQNEMSLDEAFEKLVYLTNKNRGKHIHEQTLRKAIQDGDVAKYIRRLDPVAYNCTRNDLGYAEEPQQTYQCGMFTGEQMKGTGQTNLLDLTDKIEDLKAVLRRMPHKYWNDPRDGWLEVRKEDLKTLGIQFAISSHSYQDGDKAYLEEDLDTTVYLQALFGATLEHKDWESFKNSCFIDEYRENIFIRNLNHYTP